MSKQLPLFYLTLASVVWILQIFTQAAGQDVFATVKVDERLSQRVKITGTFTDSAQAGLGRNLSFLSEYAGIQGLGSRISEVSLFDGAGRAVANRRMIDGEYLADRDFSRAAYEVAVRPPSRPSASAHISWIDGDAGVLMFGDLFPRLSSGKVLGTSIKFDVPPTWTIQSSEASAGKNTFLTLDLTKAVFFVGATWRELQVPDTPVRLAIEGERHVSDEEAAAMVREIYSVYRGLFGGHPAMRLQIGIARLPGSSQPGEWYAETRGTTVTIVSRDMPFRTQSQQRLHEQLRHELIHLWVPNAMSLKGRYDWFYEGFALYESLKTGVRLNRIRFEDFLDTLSRAHRFDSAIPPKESIVDASENRWMAGNDRVYARGMLVAFLCDLAMLNRSKGKRSIEDILAKLYSQYSDAAEAPDANVAVLRLLRSYPELTSTVNRYITGTERVGWEPELRMAGIEATETGLAVGAKPTGSQKVLLDKLGYNNWRKLSRNSK